MPISSSDGGYKVELPVDGCKVEDIEITYCDTVITVTGSTGGCNFSRSLSVPEDVDENSIEANVENGMLTLKIKNKAEDAWRGTRVRTIKGDIE